MRQVFDRELGSIDDIYRFVDKIDCPRFTYDDMLMCYAEMVGEQWMIPFEEQRAPPIPTRSQLNRKKKEKLTVNVVPQERKTARKAPARWTQEESLALVRGIERHGWGKWTLIHNTERILKKNREYRQIRDKAKWLKRTGQYDSWVKRLHPQIPDE